MFEGKEEYKPPDKLIRVTSPTMTIIWGSVIIVTGIIFVVVALFHQHYIAYGFVAQLPDGTTSVVACRMADARLHYQLRIGDEFAVRYLPSNLHIGAPVAGSCQVRRR